MRQHLHHIAFGGASKPSMPTEVYEEYMKQGYIEHKLGGVMLTRAGWQALTEGKE